MAIFAKEEKVKPVNASLFTAAEYLFQRMDRDYDPVTLNQNLGDLEDGEDPWVLFTLVDPQLKVLESGEFGTWPSSNNSVVRFRIADENNPGAEIDHYCIVADAGDRQVIDSATGVIKNGNVFGQPMDWATFGVGAGADEDEQLPKEKDPSRYYTVLKGGENAYQIAIKLGINSTDLIEHNGIEDPDLPEGLELHLPTALPSKPKQARTAIELLEYPTKMHVVKEGGTRKIAFGNAKTLDQMSQTGPAYPQNTNVTIVAVAHVPLQDEGKDVVAAYYMDQLAVGNYQKTGRVAWEIGFNHSHLAEGHVEKVRLAVEPRPEIKEKLKQMELEQKVAQEVAAMDINRPAPKEPTLEQKIAKMEADQKAHPERYPDLWKASIRPLNEQREVITYIANENMMVKEHSGKRPDKPLYKHQGVKLKYTFEKDGILYGMPATHEQTGLWFGIPLDLLTAEDDLFNVHFDLPTRVHLNAKLTMTERYISVPLSKALNHKWLKSHVEKIKKI